MSLGFFPLLKHSLGTLVLSCHLLVNGNGIITVGLLMYCGRIKCPCPQ